MSIYRDPPVAENLPDHLDFGDFRPEAEEMEVERLATIQEGDEQGHTGGTGGGGIAAGPPPISFQRCDQFGHPSIFFVRRN